MCVDVCVRVQVAACIVDGVWREGGGNDAGVSDGWLNDGIDAPVAASLCTRARRQQHVQCVGLQQERGRRAEPVARRRNYVKKSGRRLLTNLLFSFSGLSLSTSRRGRRVFGPRLRPPPSHFSEHDLGSGRSESMRARGPCAEGCVGQSAGLRVWGWTEAASRGRGRRPRPPPEATPSPRHLH